MTDSTAALAKRLLAPGARRPFFSNQPIMRRVIYALAPVLASGIYFFGWRALAVLIISAAAGVATEYLMERRLRRPVSTACLVTVTLYALSLPPTVPLWVAAVGAVVGVLFGKEVFGGFGRNFANPAIVGRAFVYVCFPVELTGRFVPAFRGWPAGLAHWSFESLRELPPWLADSGRTVADAVTAASPMWALRDYGHVTPAWDLVLGRIGGWFQHEGATRILAAGSIGEGCAPIILAAGVYLLLTRTANWRLMLSPFAGAAAAGLLFRHALGFADVQPLYFKLLAGAFLYASVFMVTEPVSAPKKPAAQLAYGALIGFLVVLLSWKSVFIAAVSFSILLGNIVSPFLDMAAAAWARRRAAPSTGAGEETA